MGLPTSHNSRKQDQGKKTGWRKWVALSLVYLILLIDAAQSFFVCIRKGDFSFDYSTPGSVIWDLWLVSLIRVALFLIITIIYDARISSVSDIKERQNTILISASVAGASADNLMNGINGDRKGSGTSTSSSSFSPEQDENNKMTSPRQKREKLMQTCQVIGVIISTLSLLFITSKCLVRLIIGIGPDDSMLWFWLAIALASIMSLVDYAVFKRHTKAVRQHVIQTKKRKRRERRRQARDGGGDLLDPLLSSSSLDENEEDTDNDEDEEEDEQEKKAKNGNATFADLLSLIRDDWHLISLAFVFLVGAAISQVLIPHFIGVVVESIVSDTGVEEFQRGMLFLVLCACMCGICTGLRGSIFTVVGARVNRRIRQMLFSSLLRQEIGFYDSTKTGEISSRLSADTTKVGDQVSLNVNFFLRNLIQALGTLIFMFIQSYKLSLVAFVSVPAIVVISKYYGEYIRKLAKRTQEKLAEANSVAEECLSSMATVRSFACEWDENRIYKEKLDEYYGLNKQEARAYGAYAVATTLLPNLVIALVLYYGGQLVINADDGMTSGKLVSFLLLLSSLSDAFNNMGSIFSAFTQALGAADKVFELIRREPKMKVSEKCLTPEECRGDVELRSVVFRYPARPTHTVLHGLDLIAQPGQIIALVGPSGGGKSSCIALLERYYDPDEGQVLLDGRPVKDYDSEWFHRKVSIVGQEPTLYNRSIKRNIIFGLEGGPHEPTDEEIREAAVLANAHEFITHLPQGYDTEVGERGTCLSGGQKQRIAIARALCRKPNVLLLDEATSALDASSEHQVQRAIDNLMERKSMTTIVIAHRLSTIKNADKILVVQSGRVVEEGNHAELLGKKGAYSALVAKQMTPAVAGGGGGDGGSSL